MKDAFAAALDSPVERAVLLAGGASKEAWAVDSDGRELLIRRAAGGVIHQGDADARARVRGAARRARGGREGARADRLPRRVEGREAFVMERIKGETIGRRIVKNPPPGLDLQLAEELAKIHAIPPERLPFLETGDQVARFYDELDSVGEPHPAIELGLHWVKERLPPAPRACRRARRLADRQHRGRRERDRRGARLGVLAPRRPGRGSRVAARARLALRRRRQAPRRHRRPRSLPRPIHRADRHRGDARGAARLGGVRQRQVGDGLPHPVAPPLQRPGAHRSSSPCSAASPPRWSTSCWT